MRLAEAGLAVDKAEASGQLEIRAWEEAYLRGNRFDPQQVIEKVMRGSR